MEVVSNGNDVGPPIHVSSMEEVVQTLADPADQEIKSDTVVTILWVARSDKNRDSYINIDRYNVRSRSRETLAVPIPQILLAVALIVDAAVATLMVITNAIWSGENVRDHLGFDILSLTCIYVISMLSIVMLYTRVLVRRSKSEQP